MSSGTRIGLMEYVPVRQPVQAAGKVTAALALCLLGLALSAGSANAAGTRVAIVLSPHEIYRGAASTIDTILTTKDQSVVVFELPKSEQAPAPSTQPTSTAPADPEVDAILRQVTESKPSVIVTLGEAASLFVADRIPRTPVVYSMITNAFDFSLTDKKDPRHSRVAGVTIDILPRQQIEWIHTVEPDARNIGLLCSDRSRQTAEVIKQAGQPKGLVITVIETRKDDFIKAVEELSARQCDGVLIIPDAQIYNAASVRRLLLWGIRSKKAVWAFSEPAVKAGALAGLYTDYDSVARQTAELVTNILAGSSPVSIGLQHPVEVRRAVNERTAEMIGVSLSKEARDAATTRFGKE
jgi:putative tryptophan/tyrosine transport system substrate-binding protein